jgi:hypothetical protein
LVGSVPGLILKYYPGIYLDVMKKNRKELRIAGFRAEILPPDLPNTK